MSKFLCNKCYYVEETEFLPKKCIVCNADESAFSLISYPDKHYIPVYWEEYLKKKTDKIRKNQELAGENGFSFAFITDIHWGPNNKFSAALVKRVMDECNLSYCVNGGDTVSGAGLCPAELIIGELKECFDCFSEIEPKLLTALGNHDPAYSTFDAPEFYVENLTTEQIYESIFRYEEKYPDRVMGPGKTYFYADDKAHKVRIVVLNTFDVPSDETLPDGRAKYNKMRLFGYRKEQLDWFANVALDVPGKDWTIILATHIAPSCTDEPCRNDDVILGIIDAFRKGEKFEISSECDNPLYNVEIKADYTNKGGSFALWVSGHIHEDSQLVVNDTLCLSVISDWNHQHEKLPMQRCDGTTNEHAFDVFTIDVENHKIYATRIGAGEDRIYEYK